MAWFRRGGVPAAVRARFRLDAGERTLAYATTRDGAHVLATERTLHLPSGEQVGWYQVEHAIWRDGWLHVREVAGRGERPREHHLRLTEPRTLPDTVRERVTATIVVDRHATLVGGRGVRVVGRRRPGSDSIGWTLAFDPGLDPSDPALRALAEEALDEVRRQTGV